MLNWNQLKAMPWTWFILQNAIICYSIEKQDFWGNYAI